MIVAAVAAPAAAASTTRALQLTLSRDNEGAEWYEALGYWFYGNGLTLTNVGDESTPDVVTITLQAPAGYEVMTEETGRWTVVTNTDGLLVLQTPTALVPGQVTRDDIQFYTRERHPESVSIPVVASAEGFTDGTAVFPLRYPVYYGDIEFDEPTYYFPVLNVPQTLTGRFVPRRPGAPIPASGSVGAGYSRPGWSRSGITVDPVTGAFSFELTWIYGEGPATIGLGSLGYVNKEPELVTG